MIKTLIVDDSSLVRNIIRDFLVKDGSFAIVGEAENGREAVEAARNLNPDLITMDIEMPVMNGLDAIGEITKFMTTAIVVISSNDSTKMAYDATVRGALEFYSKDVFTDRADPRRKQKVLDTLKKVAGIKKSFSVPVKSRTGNAEIAMRRIEAVVIAASTGGPKAMSSLCADLHENFPVPILLVQHNSSGFDAGFVQWLGIVAALKVCLAEEGVKPAAGYIYVAPTDTHLVLKDGVFMFDHREPVHNQKPAADILFESAAKTYGKALVSVVLTGMGSDGAEGTVQVKKAGGITIAQDEQSSAVYGMPQAATETGCVDIVLPLNSIAGKLVSLTENVQSGGKI